MMTQEARLGQKRSALALGANLGASEPDRQLEAISVNYRNMLPLLLL